VAGAGIFMFRNHTASGASKSSAETPSTNSTTSSFAFALALFDDGKVRHYQYQDEETTIRYFIIQSSEGTIHAAFDACDVCWRAGKGYTQKNDSMVCHTCGRTFPIQQINQVTGGCNPAPLQHTVADGAVVVRIEDILQGKKFFLF